MRRRGERSLYSTVCALLWCQADAVERCKCVRRRGELRYLLPPPSWTPLHRINYFRQNRRTHGRTLQEVVCARGRGGGSMQTSEIENNRAHASRALTLTSHTRVPRAVSRHRPLFKYGTV